MSLGLGGTSPDTTRLATERACDDEEDEDDEEEEEEEEAPPNGKRPSAKISHKVMPTLQTSMLDVHSTCSTPLTLHPLLLFDGDNDPTVAPVRNTAAAHSFQDDDSPPRRLTSLSTGATASGGKNLGSRLAKWALPRAQ